MGKATYLDSSVLIAGFRATEPQRSLARSIIYDPQRRIVLSEFSKLERVPLPVKNRRLAEVAYLEDIFTNVAEPVRPVPVEMLFKRALGLACKYGLSGMDALHLACCLEEQVEEFVTLETQRRAFGTVAEPGLLTVFLGKGFRAATTP